jgi:hypothetical protein
MPVRVNAAVTVGGGSVENPFIGPVQRTVAIAVPLSGLTSAEVDANGYIKPGVPLLRTGALVTAGAVWGVTVEATKVANSNSGADLAAGGSPEVAVAVDGAVNRAIMEDNLGRVLTAAEIAGFALAGSTIRLIS